MTKWPCTSGQHTPLATALTACVSWPVRWTQDRERPGPDGGLGTQADVECAVQGAPVPRGQGQVPTVAPLATLATSVSSDPAPATTSS